MSLFGEDSNSPWSLPEPKARSENRIVSVLAGANIPYSYKAAWEATHAIGEYTEVQELEETIAKARPRLEPEQVDLVLSIVAPKRSGSISRAQWNVAMCLVGLAQSGETDLNLDLVDFNRKNLPAVSIEGIERASPVTSGSFAASPTDRYWSQSPPLSEDPPDSQAPLMSQSTPALTSTQPGAPVWSASTVDPETYTPTAPDTITISIVPEREGLFMFRHVVYKIEGRFPDSGKTFSVVRRYSDFLWLLECLVKTYPFRLLPVLPPKRLAVDGRYLSSDSYFLERRRRGLSRFVNQLVKRQLFRKEKLVQMFLTVDTELAVWRKQSSFQLQEEFAGRVIDEGFKARWNEDAEVGKWRAVRQGSEDALEIISQMCLLVDRIAKRNEAMAGDLDKLGRGFSALRVPLADVYTNTGNPESGTEDYTSIREGLDSASRYATSAKDLHRDQSLSTDIGVLEDLKQLRELIASIRELFIRHEKLGGNNIGQLEQRIALHERKIAGLQRNSSGNANSSSETEIKKLRAAIAKDRESIQYQTNRDWLIKQCLTEEMVLCQRTQYQVSKAVQAWALENVKYSELLQTNWTELSGDVDHMAVI
ncbi:hypothetical protein TRVA0_074S00320 [Trichomonascus vanleenenianus]|uniref:Mvp1p n=1 Tax=Trichomonascus vanleenenianus TaxID=2268995 RepID=UPI003ECAC954